MERSHSFYPLLIILLSPKLTVNTITSTSREGSSSTDVPRESRKVFCSKSNNNMNKKPITPKPHTLLPTFMERLMNAMTFKRL